MSTITWTDSTSYSRNRPSVQTAWSVALGPVRVTIMLSHIYYPGRWAYYIEPGMGEAREMPGRIAADDVTAAQATALDLALTHLRPYVTAYDAILKATS